MPAVSLLKPGEDSARADLDEHVAFVRRQAGDGVEVDRPHDLFAKVTGQMHIALEDSAGHCAVEMRVAGSSGAAQDRRLAKRVHGIFEMGRVEGGRHGKFGPDTSSSRRARSSRR